MEMAAIVLRKGRGDFVGGGGGDDDGGVVGG